MTLAIIALITLFVFQERVIEPFETTVSVPEWATTKPTRQMRQGWGTWTDVVNKNVQRLRAAEARGIVDFVLYGDSITAFLNGYTLRANNPGSEKVWTDAFRGLNAVALGVAGDQIGQVLWRIMNAERPTYDPKVIGLHIGINDLIGWGTTPGAPVVPSTLDRLAILIRTMAITFPTSHILVLALTPVNGAKLRTKKIEHNRNAAKLVTQLAQNESIKVSYLNAAQMANIEDPKTGGPRAGSKALGDEVHMSAKGHIAHLAVVRQAVDSILTGQARP